MKVVMGFILGFACMFVIAFDNEVSKLNHIQLDNKLYRLDLPEEAPLISDNIAKPDTMVSWISGDTLHFGFKISLQSRENKSKYRFDQHIDLNTRTP